MDNMTLKSYRDKILSFIHKLIHCHILIQSFNVCILITLFQYLVLHTQAGSRRRRLLYMEPSSLKLHDLLCVSIKQSADYNLQIQKIKTEPITEIIWVWKIRQGN
jgi:hypothetical protein